MIDPRIQPPPPALPPLTPARSADVSHLLDRVLLPAKATMTFISLFSGIGGFDLGFERAGMQCAAQIEIDAKARAVLNRHFPAVPVMEDVRHAGKHNLPAVDLIAGGFPCQDVSVAGNRAGLAGERSGLWFEFLRIVTELAPKWVVIENVPGLLSSNRGRDFAVILHGLVSVGYRVGWRVLDAQYFGLAQQRQRVFIVGSLRDGRCAEALFETHSELSQKTSKRMVAPTLIARGQVDNGGGSWASGIAIEDIRGIRRLTPTECERLQGFPDGWTDGQPDSARYRQLGNAVAVPVAEWLGRRIKEAS